MYQEQKTLAFSKIAGQYDLINDVMSFGMHRYWKQMLVSRILKMKADSPRVLDIASGTGDLARYFITRSQGPSRMVGIDPSPEMLRVAKQKVPKAEFYITKSENLIFSENSFDAITCTFGPRNMDDLDLALQQWKRVLTPDGVVGVIESHPVEPGMFNFPFTAYWRWIVPLIGKIINKKEAYEYLVNSTQNFLSRSKLVDSFEKNGFETLQSKALLPYGQISLSLFKNKS